MDRVGEAGRDLRLTWSRWLVALFAAAVVVWVAWSMAQDAVGAPGDAPSSSAAGTLASLGSLGLALLVLSVALVSFAALYVRTAARQQRLAEELRDSRETLRRVDELVDVWQWQSDSAHRIVSMRAPQAPGASQGPTPGWRPDGSPLLWEHFVADDPFELRHAVERAAPLADVAVHLRDGAAGRRAIVRARVRTDAQGAFAGYQGTLREADPAEPRAAGKSAQDGTGNEARAPLTQPAAQAESDSFSYTVSHDLRAPIRVVEGFTKIVKEDYGRLLDRVGNDHLDRVLGAAARMNNMIDALLALSKLSSQPLVRQAVNLSQLAVYVADDLHRQSPGRQVGVDIQPGMQVEGDPTLLRVVVENLLGNAWKYTGKCEQAQIWFERSEGTDSFTIRDNGAGFDMRFADRLFGVFQRLHSANDFPGTGVGLATVRRIIKRHGGEIWGEAEPNRGARFHFTLPQERR